MSRKINIGNILQVGDELYVLTTETWGNISFEKIYYDGETDILYYSRYFKRDGERAFPEDDFGKVWVRKAISDFFKMRHEIENRNRS